MKTIALSVLVAVASIAHAQEFKFTPKWQPGQSIDLEHIYSNHEKKNDGTIKFDTTYVDMKVKFVKEDEYFYFFDWWFLSYYQDTTLASTTTEKLTGPIIAKCVTQLPIKIRVEKADWEIKVLNQTALDSVRDIVLKEWIANAPKKDESGLMQGMLELSVSLQMEKKIMGIINDYFAAYRMKNMELNRRLTMAELQKLKGVESGSAELFGNMDMDGYAILDDTHPQYYLFHWEVKMDMSKMMNIFGDMAKAFAKEEGKKKKGKKEEPKATTPIDTSAPAYSTRNLDIKVNKADMSFISSTETEAMDGSKTFMETESSSVKILRVKP